MICDRMNDEASRMQISAVIDIIISFLGFASYKIKTTIAFDLLLVTLLLDLVFKVFVYSYILGFPGLYVQLCTLISKEATYPTFVFEALVYIFCFGAALKLRSLLASKIIIHFPNVSQF